MKKTVLLALVAVVAVSSPAMAKSHYDHHHPHVYREASRDHHRMYREPPDYHRLDRETSDRHREQGEKSSSSHVHITCDMVRAYVAQVGLVQARAMALSAGMTASDERRAKRCLESGA